MIGACGSVASTVALGVAALRSRRSTTTGLVTALSPFAGAELVDPGSIVIGGHEIRSELLVDAVKALHVRARLFDADLIKACTGHLRSVQRNIRVGTICAASPTVRRLADQNRVMRDRKPAAAVERLAADMTEFRRRHRLHHVVVVRRFQCHRP